MVCAACGTPTRRDQPSAQEVHACATTPARCGPDWQGSWLSPVLWWRWPAPGSLGNPCPRGSLGLSRSASSICRRDGGAQGTRRTQRRRGEWRSCSPLAISAPGLSPHEPCLTRSDPPPRRAGPNPEPSQEPGIPNPHRYPQQGDACRDGAVWQQRVAAGGLAGGRARSSTAGTFHRPMHGHHAPLMLPPSC